MKVNGEEHKEKVMEHKLGVMVLNMLGNGNRVMLMGRGNFII